MFTSKLAAATNGAAIAAFMNEAVAHLGYGIEAVTGANAEAGPLTSYSLGFTANGTAGTIAFAVSEHAYGDTDGDNVIEPEIGEKAPTFNQGVHVDAPLANATVWTVTVAHGGKNTKFTQMFSVPVVTPVPTPTPSTTPEE